MKNGELNEHKYMTYDPPYRVRNAFISNGYLDDVSRYYIDPVYVYSVVNHCVRCIDGKLKHEYLEGSKDNWCSCNKGQEMRNRLL